MRVLQIHSSDHLGGGGGTVAMERLHQGLLVAGVDSRVLCGRKTTRSSLSKPIPGSRMLKRVESYLGTLTTELGLNDIHYLSSFKIKSMEEYKKADILHFHGTHGFFNYLALPTLVKHKPGVFTLHDIWPLTGHCAYSYDCERWKLGCGKCPHLDAHPAVKRDNTRIEWKLKRWVYRRSKLTVVSLSKWTTKLAQQSILNQFNIVDIPNGIDTDIFRPLDRKSSRSLLGIPSDKYVLMFVALRLDDYRKGGDLLERSLKALPDAIKKRTVLLMLGDGGGAIAQAVGIDIINLGYVRNDRLKAIAYSASDVFVFPSRGETFGLVLAESMACGTPMVSFDVGGISEIVRPGLTGYLAESENAKQLTEGMLSLLEDESQYNILAQKCREIATKEYGIYLQVKRHLNLYEEILS